MSNRGEMNVVLQPRQQMRVDMQPSSQASRIGDYNELLNKPSVNGVELIGDKTSEGLKIIISKSNTDWETYADVTSYKDTIYVYVGTVTQVKVGDGITTIGTLPFVSAEDPRIEDVDITSWNNKAEVTDIPTALAELEDDSSHRLVTDAEKSRWDSTVSNVQSDWNESDPTAGAFIKNKPSLFSGSYNDLTDKPEIPDDLADLNADSTHRLVTDAEKATWNAKSSFSGSYNDLTDKPDIPDDLSDLHDDTTHRLVTDAEKSTWNAKSDFSGSYADLTNKPDIPDDLADLNDDSTHRLVTDVEKTAWNAKSDFSGSYDDLTDKPDLADLQDDATHRTVTDEEKTAWNGKSDFSGSYSDLTDKPSIPDALSDLDDIALSNIQNGQILKYNSTTQKFENANESGGTISDAYKKIKVASTEITASGEDTFELVAGTNVTLVPDAANKKVTINATGGGGGGSTGDMLKEIYDTNNDGIVNAADEAATLTGLNATVAELNALSGVTSNVQSQLNDKADASDIPTALSDLSDDSTHRLVTDAEKTAWDAKSDFSGSYTDLTDKPSIPDDLADLNDDSTHRLVTDTEKSTWNAKSDFSGSYNDLTDKPSIPDDLADLNEDTTHRLVTDAEKTAWNAKSNFSGSYTDLTDKPSIPDDLADLNDDSTHRLVTDTEKTAWDAKSDFSGSYNDLTNKPSIPDDLADLSDDATHRLVTDVEKAAWDAKSDFSGSYNDLTNKPTIPDDLADLNEDSTHRLVTDSEKATWNGKSDFSGSYNDLTDKPAIPAAQVQSDWNQTSSTAVDYIKNKPSIPTDLADLQDDSTHRLVTDVEKSSWDNKSDFSGSYNDLTDKPSIPAPQIQSDWGQTDSTALDFIKNKPNIPSGQVQSDWNESDSAAVDFIKNKPTIPDELADLQDDASHRTVSDTEKSTWNNKSDFSGDYNDLTNKPSIPAAQVNADWNASGTVAEILNKPSIPSDIDDLGDVAITNIQDGQVLKYNSTTQKFENADESGGAGGHTIENPAGTEMTQRTNLQFLDANVTDDSTNDKTKVENVKVIQSESELTNAPDGIYMGNYDDTTQHVAEANAIDYDNTDSGLDADNVQDAVDEVVDIKANKVTNATENNFAALDANGNLKDSGHKHSDYLTQHQDISGKADKVDSATNGNLAGLDASGNLTDSGWNGAKDTTSASGNPISITGLKSDQLAVNPIITFEPIQAGSGTPSPSNIRAISGYDKVEVLSHKPLIASYQHNMAIGNDGKPYTNADCMLVNPKFNCKSGEKFYISITAVANLSIILQGYNSSGGYLGYYRLNNNSYFVPSTLLSGCTSFYIQLNGSGTGEPTSYTFETTDISESLGQTVYGLTHEVRTGKARVIYKAVDMGDLSWYMSSGTHYFTASIADKKEGTHPLWCSMYNYTENGGYSTPNNGISDSRSTSYLKTVFVRDDSQSSSADFGTAVTGQTLVYELATPFTIQLTPHEISLLKDYAYVSTNGTTIALDYHNGEMASLADVSQLGETVNTLVNNTTQVKLVNIPYSNFSWDSNSKSFYYNVALDKSRLLGFLVHTTNGRAILGAYYSSLIYVYGWLPTTGASIDGTYQFECYAIYRI
jgi:hypothetical protein